MPRRACLAIGVSNVLPRGGGAPAFANLDGAIIAAEQIGLWALRCNFGPANVQVVTDGASASGATLPVTEARVQAAVDALFPAGAAEVDHFVLSFCGHGLTGAEIGSAFWLFSDADQRRYQVSVDGFIAELTNYGVRRVSLISDACRDIPSTFGQLRLESRRGIEASQPRQVPSPMFDRLAACQDGQKGYMVGDNASASAGKCILSGVVLDVLWGKEPAAFNGNLIDTSGFGRVTRQRATERAQDYGLTLNPQCAVDPEPAPLVEKALVSAPPPPQLQAWPPPSRRVTMGNVTARAGSDFFWRGSSDVTESAAAPGPADEVERQLSDWANRTPVVPSLVVTGAKVRRLWSRQPIAETSVENEGSRFVFKSGRGDAVGSVLVEFADGFCAPVYLYPSLYVVMARGDEGLTALAYGGQESEIFADSTKAIVDLTAGRLSLGDIDHAAAQLRMDKHANPVLGAIAAHFYRAVSDVDSIRRMAFFYVKEGQAIPYDIALLGDMQIEKDATGNLLVKVPAVRPRAALDQRSVLPDYVTRATDAVTGALAGGCPWLTMGWDYPPVAAFGPARDALQWSRETKRPSNFTLLKPGAGPKLAALLGLKPTDVTA
jgi:hypothetical protein